MVLKSAASSDLQLQNQKWHSHYSKETHRNKLDDKLKETEYY